jgi:hypothetical protein
MGVRCLLTTTFCALPLLAQPLNQGERDRALSALHGSRKLLVDSVAGLSKAQMSFKPASEVWSVGEVVEHLALLEESVYKMVTVDAMKTPPASPEQREAVRKNDEAILKVIADRSQKGKAPESISPPGRFKTPQEALTAFKTARDRSCALIRETQEPLREHILPTSPMGPMDAYQWFLMLGAHTERHVAQILEVEANPNFPKK